MSDDATIPNDFPATEPEANSETSPTAVLPVAPATAPAPTPQRAHSEHGWLSWVIIALGVLAAVAMIAVGVRIVFGHHLMAVAAMRHAHLSGMPFRRGPFRPFAPRGWRR